MTEPTVVQAELLEVQQRSVGLELATGVTVLALGSPLLALLAGWAWRVFRWAAWG